MGKIELVKLNLFKVNKVKPKWIALAIILYSMFGRLKIKREKMSVHLCLLNS